MLIWHSTEQVIVTASANNPPWARVKLFANVKCRERRGSHEDKQDASCYWRCGPFVGGRLQQRLRSCPARAISTVIGSGNWSGRVLGSDRVTDDKAGDLQGGSPPRPT